MPARPTAHLVVALAALAAPAMAHAQAGDAALERKIDRAIAEVGSEPGFEAYHRDLVRLRQQGDVRLTRDLPRGMHLEAQGSNRIVINPKIVRLKSAAWLASALVHEAVHLRQDDSRYAYAEEMEFKAYQEGGRFKRRKGLPLHELELAATSLDRASFVEQAAIIYSRSWSNQEELALTLDRSILMETSLEVVRALARRNGVPGWRTRPRTELARALESRHNRAGLEELSTRDLRILARRVELKGGGRLPRAALVEALTNRLDPARLRIFPFKVLQGLAREQGAEARGVRSKDALIRTMIRHDAARKANRPARRSSARPARAPVSRTTARARR